MLTPPIQLFLRQMSFTGRKRQALVRKLLREKESGTFEMKIGSDNNHVRNIMSINYLPTASRVLNAVRTLCTLQE